MSTYSHDLAQLKKQNATTDNLTDILIAMRIVINAMGCRVIDYDSVISASPSHHVISIMILICELIVIIAKSSTSHHLKD